MSPTATGSDREKFDSLLQLSLEQVRALEADDMNAFDHILAAKNALVGSFQDARALVASDSALAGIIGHIQEADKTAQRLLYHKTGRIMRQLTEIGQQKRARHAYQSPGGVRADAPPPDASRFLDRGT